MIKIKNEENTNYAQGEPEDFKCCTCGEPLAFGYLCKTERVDRVFCENCQKQWNKENINKDKLCWIDNLNNIGEHSHLRFIRR